MVPKIILGEIVSQFSKDPIPPPVPVKPTLLKTAMSCRSGARGGSARDGGSVHGGSVRGGSSVHGGSAVQVMYCPSRRDVCSTSTN